MLSLKKSDYASILNHLEVVRTTMKERGVRMSLIRRIDDAKDAINEVFIESFMEGRHRHE